VFASDLTRSFYFSLCHNQFLNSYTFNFLPVPSYTEVNTTIVECLEVWFLKLGVYDLYSDKMSEVKNLDDFYDWVEDEYASDFLGVVLNILRERPNVWVTIRDIAASLNKQFVETFAEEMTLLLFPICFLPGIERREDEDDALWAFKYNPDAEKEFKKTGFERLAYRQISHWDLIEEAYAESIDDNIDYFKGEKREKKLKKRDELIDKLEKQLRKTQMDEWTTRGDL